MYPLKVFQSSCDFIFWKHFSFVTDFSKEDDQNDSLKTPKSQEYKNKSFEQLTHPYVKNDTVRRTYKIYRGPNDIVNVSGSLFESESRDYRKI